MRHLAHLYKRRIGDHWLDSGKSRRNIELVLLATLGAFLVLQTAQMA
jgi:hypothetical protein